MVATCKMVTAKKLGREHGAFTRRLEFEHLERATAGRDE